MILKCVASGQERTIRWSKDGGEQIPGNHFTLEETTLRKSEGFKYKQDEALQHVLTWIEGDRRCDEVTRHNRTYTCEATTTIRDIVTKETRKYTVDVKCE